MKYSQSFFFYFIVMGLCTSVSNTNILLLNKRRRMLLVLENTETDVWGFFESWFGFFFLLQRLKIFSVLQ